MPDTPREYFNLSEMLNIKVHNREDTYWQRTRLEKILERQQRD